MRITEVLVAKSSRKTRFKHFNFFSNFQQKNGITFDMQTPNKKNTWNRFVFLFFSHNLSGFEQFQPLQVTEVKIKKGF